MTPAVASRRTRRLWLGTAVAVVAVVVSGCGGAETATVAAGGGSLGQPIGSVPASGSPGGRPASPGRPSGQGSPAPARGPEAIHLPGVPSRGAPRSRAILATASRFAVAYLRYQIGRDPPWVKRAIRATCAPSFADRLLSEPVSVPDAQRANPVDQASTLDRLRYTGLASLGAGPPVGIVLAHYHTIRHPGVRGVLTIQVAGTGSSWRVTGLD